MKIFSYIFYIFIILYLLGYIINLIYTCYLFSKNNHNSLIQLEMKFSTAITLLVYYPAILYKVYIKQMKIIRELRKFKKDINSIEIYGNENPLLWLNKNEFTFIELIFAGDGNLNHIISIGNLIIDKLPKIS